MNRRVLIIIAFSLGVIALGAILFFVFFHSGGTNTNGNTNQPLNANGVLPNTNGNANFHANANGALPNINGVNVNQPTTNVNGPGTVADGGDTLVKTLVSSNAKYVVTDANGNILYYDPTTGQFYKLDANGNLVPLTGARFPSAESVTWSTDRSQAIISFPDDSKVYYDFNTKKQATLPKEGQDFSFAPNGNQIAFKYNAKNEADRFLVVSNPDGTGMKTIEPLGDVGDQVQVSWSPNDQVIATFSKGLNGTSQEILLSGKNNENFKSIITDGRGFESSWSPDGQRLLYSTYNSASDFNPVLHIVDAQGDRIGGDNTSLDLQTWADKCAFGSGGSMLFCAVPNTLPSGSGIYREQASQTTDSFYQIDLKTGAKSQIAVPVGSDGSRQFSAMNLSVSPDGRILYFTDAPTGRVLQLRVK